MYEIKAMSTSRMFFLVGGIVRQGLKARHQTKLVMIMHPVLLLYIGYF